MKDDTRLIHTQVARGPSRTVNPPIERGSTLLCPTRKVLVGSGTVYGRMGLTVQRELEAALRLLENASYVNLAANGLQACALATGGLVTAGDHVLIADSLYGPNRRFCTRRLAAMGVQSTRFATHAPIDLAALVQPNTTVIVLESPGSLTFDVLDTPAIVAFARAHDLITIFDNTWGAGVVHRPLDLGVDVVIQALTKYPVGHADAMGGAVLTNSARLAGRLRQCSEDWGISLAPDDAYSALRGLRTIHTRLRQHEASAYTVARWLETRPEVHAVLHPGLASHPQHDLWHRDFTGANGLFGVVLNAATEAELDAFLEAMNLFAMGYSWGGFESLLIPCDDQLERLPGDPILTRPGPLLRVHVGLEDPGDLIGDLTGAFAAMGRA